jgi:hypothetical protein
MKKNREKRKRFKNRTMRTMMLKKRVLNEMMAMKGAWRMIYREISSALSHPVVRAYHNE